jgi:putative ABC transport system permease protein
VRGLPDVGYDDLRGALGPETHVVGIEAGDARVYNPYLILGLNEEELGRSGPCAEDPALLQALTKGQGVILSKRVAHRYGKQVGDSIHLPTGGHGVQTFPVVAISDAYGYFYDPDERLYGVVGADIMHRYYCLDVDTMSFAALRIEEGHPPDAAIAALRHTFANVPDLTIKRGRDLLDWHVADITEDFQLFDLILGLTALLAALGVLNGQLLSALERWKEVGVLRALGSSRGQLAGMVLLESAVIGITGAVLGLVLGSILTPLIVEALQVISSLPLPHRTAGAWLAWSVAGAVALTLLAGLYPIWRMNRFDAVRAVRTG